MHDWIVLLLLPAPFLVLGAVIAYLIITIGKGTAKSK
jgi:hypothetical protein